MITVTGIRITPPSTNAPNAKESAWCRRLSQPLVSGPLVSGAPSLWAYVASREQHKVATRDGQCYRAADIDGVAGDGPRLLDGVPHCRELMPCQRREHIGLDLSQNVAGVVVEAWIFNGARVHRLDRRSVTCSRDDLAASGLQRSRHQILGRA